MSAKMINEGSATHSRLPVNAVRPSPAPTLTATTALTSAPQRIDGQGDASCPDQVVHLSRMRHGAPLQAGPAPVHHDDAEHYDQRTEHQHG